LAKFVVLHVDVADAAAQAEHLLKLELDRSSKVVALSLKIVSENDGGGELVGTVHVGADDTRDGLDDGLGGEEGVEAGAELLDELLVLVELLEGVHVGDGHVDLLGLVLVLEVGDEADVHTGAAEVGEAEGAGEALVLGGVVVLQVDLEVDGLGELALLAVVEDSVDGGLESVGGDLGHVFVLLKEFV